jgi:tetratricopeptide (TPR) repeat protein
MTRETPRGRWHAEHPGGGWGVVDRPHGLDLSIKDEDARTVMMDFWFRFDRPEYDTTPVHQWVEKFRDAVVKRSYPGLVWGVVSPDATSIDFDPAPPTFYRPALENFLLVRSRTKRRQAWIGAAAAMALGVTVLVVSLALPGSVSFTVLLLWTLIFVVAPPLSTTLAEIYYERSGERPNRVQTTFEGVKLIWNHGRTLLIPWNHVESLELAPKSTVPPLMHAFHHQEYIITWKDIRGRRRSFWATYEVQDLVGNGQSFYPPLSQDERTNHLVWFAAPAGTRIAVAVMPLDAEERQLRKFRQRFPRNGQTYVWYVTEEEDLRITRENLRGRAPSPTAAPLLAEEAMRREYWDDAAELWTAACSLDPSNVEHMSRLVTCLTRQGRTREAKAFLGEHQKQHGPSSRLQVLLSFACREEGDFAGALGAIGKAVELDPNNPDALFMWYDIVAAEGGIAHALTELETVAGTKPVSWAAPYVLAIRASEGGAKAKALEYFESALEREVNDDTVGAYFDFLLWTKESDRALVVVERALKAPARLTSQAWYNLGKRVIVLDRRDLAQALLGRISDPELKRSGEDLLRRL